MEQNSDGNDKQAELKNRLKTILAEVNLSSHQDKITQLSNDLQISVFDCATVLFLLHLPECPGSKTEGESLNDAKTKTDLPFTQVKQKCVRYRMEVGRIHEVAIEEIKRILVEVSGVEYNRIGRLEIRNHYSLVDLPDGMPADIFQLLSETEVNKQRLSLRRIKFQRRTQRRKRKRYS